MTLSQAEVEKKLVAAACLIGYSRAIEILQDKRARLSVLDSAPSKKKSSGVVHARSPVPLAFGKGARSLCGAAKGPEARYAVGGEAVTCGRCKKVQSNG